MSVADIAARMGELAARFNTATQTATTAAASAASATDFASVLAAAGIDDPAALLDSASGPAAGSGGVTGDAVVEAAKKYLGVPYVFGGETSEGMDCSGLVQRVFADLGIDVPRLVSGQGALGEVVPSLAEARPGDLVVADDNSHIGIYVGDGKMLHAPRAGKDVRIADVWWSENEMTIKRVVPAQTTPAQAVAPASQADTAAMLRSMMLSGATR